MWNHFAEGKGVMRILFICMFLMSCNPVYAQYADDYQNQVAQSQANQLQQMQWQQQENENQMRQQAAQQQQQMQDLQNQYNAQSPAQRMGGCC